MEDIEKSLNKIYLALNQTVCCLYDSLSSMSAPYLDTYTNICLLKKLYQSNSSDKSFLNLLILSFTPHIEKIKRRDKEYFVQFVIDRVGKNIEQEQQDQIRLFVGGLSEKNLRILWTFADNFVQIAEKFQKICKDNSWLEKECIRLSKNV